MDPSAERDELNIPIPVVLIAMYEFGRALDARGVVARERRFDVTVCREAARQNHSILDRHVGPLRQHRFGSFQTNPSSPSGHHCHPIL